MSSPDSYSNDEARVKSKQAEWVIPVNLAGRGGLPLVQLYAGNHKIEAIIDTGASFGVTGDEKLSQRSTTLHNAVLYPEAVEAYDGSITPVESVIKADLELDGQILRTVLLYVPACGNRILLGSNNLEEVGGNIDYPTQTLTWENVNGKEIQTKFTLSNNRSINMLEIKRHTTLKSNSGHLLRIPVEGNEGTQVEFEGTKELQDQGLFLPRSINTIENGCITIPVLNISNRLRKIGPRTPIGQWNPVNPNTTMIEVPKTHADNNIIKIMGERLENLLLKSGHKNKSVIGETEIKFGETISKVERDCFVNLCRLFPTIFSNDKKPLNSTHKIKCHIPVEMAPGEPPINSKLRRMTPRENEIIQQELNKMMEQDIIEPSDAAWSFPVVLAKKPDGSWRFCVDYRKLNSKTKRDVYPLPRIDDALDHLGGCKYFSSFDLRSGYWQIPMDEDSKDLTTFITKFGLYRFKRMPFGLSNAPSYFQRFMDSVISGLGWYCAMVYLDDVLIYSKTLKDHLCHVALLFQRLSQAGLTLKPKKCTIAATSLDYLGFRVGAKGVSPQTRLTSAITEYPEPKDTKEVKRFVAMCNFYRRFIPNFSITAEPLYQLLKKNVKFEWSQSCKTSFDRLKSMLINAPVLAAPDFSKPFILATDAASKVGIGGVLMQEYENGPRPVSYTSRKFTPAEKNYSVTEQECLACLHCIKEFRPYLHGRRFSLLTDHQALKWLLQNKEPTGRLRRWLWSFLEYDFDVIYVPGAHNVVPDALSRTPIIKEEQKDEPNTNEESSDSIKFLELVSTHKPTWESISKTLKTTYASVCTLLSNQIPKEDLINAQNIDKECQRALENNLFGEFPCRVRNDGVIVVEIEDGTNRILLPRGLYGKVLRECHDSRWGGHLGMHKTYHRVQQLYRGSNLRTFTRSWIESCRDCGSRKVKPSKVIPPLRTQDMGEFGDRLSMDFMGPFRPSPEGYTYVLLVVEYQTRYAFAIPTKSATAAEAAKALYNGVICHIGPPREILSDSAKCFVGRVIDNLCYQLQIEQLHPVPYRPQYNGLVERFIRTVKDELSHYVNENQDNWYEFLGSVVLAYNTSVQSSTGFSPYQLLYGRLPRLPSQLLLESRGSQSLKPTELNQHLQKSLKWVLGEARKNFTKAQQKQAENYNRKLRKFTQHYVTGDIVWVYNEAKEKGTGKLRQHWRGPKEVLQSTGYDNYEVKDLITKDTKITHISLMRPFKTMDEELDNMAEVLSEYYSAEENNSLIMDELITDDEGVMREIIGRRRHRNKSGRYELQIQLQDLVDAKGEHKWVPIDELHQVFRSRSLV